MTADIGPLQVILVPGWNFSPYAQSPIRLELPEKYLRLPAPRGERYLVSETQHEQIVALLTSHQQRLTFFIRSLVANRADADEVLQEVNLFVWRHATEFQLGTDFAAWSFRIAHFKVGTYWKRQARDRARLSDSVVDELAQQAIDLSSTSSQRQDALDLCLKKLTDEDRKLVLLRYEPQATTETVAKCTNRSVKAIYKALNRIRTRLLECVDRTLAGEGRAP